MLKTHEKANTNLNYRWKIDCKGTGLGQIIKHKGITFDNPITVYKGIGENYLGNYFKIFDCSKKDMDKLREYYKDRKWKLNSSNFLLAILNRNSYKIAIKRTHFVPLAFMYIHLSGNPLKISDFF